MKSGYESLVWIKDKNGKEYACYAEDSQYTNASQDPLNDERLSHCLDVSQIVGTERW